MLYKKTGFPQEGDLVVGVVSKIHPTSVFVKLEYYDNKVGVLHISEIAPGRIRNLNEYVSVGKTIVLQVLRVNSDRGHIDLSLRRVSAARRVKKMSEMKQELKAEKIIETAAEELKLKFEELYDKIASAVFDKYEYIHTYFMDIVMGEAEYSLMKLPKAQVDVLKNIITNRIKPPIMEIQGTFVLKSFAGDGLEKVRTIITKIKDLDKDMVVTYGGAGAYPFIIRSESFDDAEAILKKAIASFEEMCKDKLTTFSFTRKEGKQVEV